MSLKLSPCVFYIQLCNEYSPPPRVGVYSFPQQLGSRVVLTHCIPGASAWEQELCARATSTFLLELAQHPHPGGTGSSGRAPGGTQMQRLKLPKGNLCSPGGAQALHIPGTEGTLQPSAVRAAARAKQSTQKASRAPGIHTGGSPSSGPGMPFLIYEALTVTFGAVRRDYFFFFSALCCNF